MNKHPNSIYKIRFNDCDMFGHLNNARYIDYLINARQDHLKDEYNFDFLEISENHNEKDLELALMKNIRKFLLELGGDFSFIGNQYRLQVDDEDFYVDLLLYNRKL